MLQSIKDDGFTFVSMLISFMIVCSLICFGLVITVDKVNDTNRNTAGLQLTSYVKMAKNCAITSKQSSYVKIDKNSLTYSCVDETHTQIYDYITFDTNYPNNIISFNSSGNVNRAGSVDICSKSCNHYTLSLGSGDISEKK